MCAVVRLRALMARQEARLITNPPIERNNLEKAHQSPTPFFNHPKNESLKPIHPQRTALLLSPWASRHVWIIFHPKKLTIKITNT
jgi:hypothetical protein